MAAVQKPTTPFILSLIGSILILSGSGVGMMWFSSGMPGWGGMGGMMGGWQGMMGFGGIFFGMTILSLIFGIIILVASLMLYSQPSQSSSWGTIILVFSVLSLFGMGGFFIGAVLGITGGALALGWKPSPT